MLRWLFIVCLALLPTASWPAAEVALPALTERVTDLTGTLSSADKALLDSRLMALEQEKGSQVAILMLPTTAPESIEQFGIRLADAWKIGRREADDGVIVIVAKDDRRMRLEIGYGLEGAIPDAVARRIIDEQMAPRFRQGDFAGGLRSTVETLEKLIRGESLPPPKAARDEAQWFDSDTLVFIVIFLASLARSLFGIAGSIGISLIAGWIAWSAFGSLVAALIAALLAFFFSFARAGRGGWHSDGGSGGRIGGGGFSGGGGGFGGGGASGRW